MVALLDGGGEVTIGGNHEQAHVSLRCTRNHVLDEVAVTGRIDDGVVPLVREELLGGARDGDTTLALLLLAVHVESEGEGRFAQIGCLFLQLLDLTLGDAAELENQTASGRRLTGVDMAADNDRKMLHTRAVIQRATTIDRQLRESKSSAGTCHEPGPPTEHLASSVPAHECPIQR